MEENLGGDEMLFAALPRIGEHISSIGTVVEITNYGAVPGEPTLGITLFVERRAVLVGVTLSPDEMTKLGAIADREGVNRPEAVRKLIEKAPG